MKARLAFARGFRETGPGEKAVPPPASAPPSASATLVRSILAGASRRFFGGAAPGYWRSLAAVTSRHPRVRVGPRCICGGGDFYSSGHYLELEENKYVKFRWFSNIDPAPTAVTVTVAEQAGGVLVRLEHEVPDGEACAGKAESFRENWVESLENLKSVLETGLDLRIAIRPMLGIVPGDFTEEQAAALGVPVREGLRLDSVVAGMGAERAGLQKDDVLVGMAGHPITNDFNSLPNAIQGQKGGDQVDVIFYRGAEKKSITMELSKRPMLEVPFDATELAKRAQAFYEPALAALEKCFEGITDEQAMRKPDPARVERPGGGGAPDFD